MKYLLFILSLLLATSLGAIPVYPPMVSGDHVFTVQAGTPLDPDGVPLDPPTGSIGIVPELGGLHIACVTTPDQLATYEIVVKIIATGQRAAHKAQAFLASDCTDLSSTLSENTAYTYPGMSPTKPRLP